MRYILITLLLIIGLIVSGQERYKPTVVVLDPYQTRYDTALLEKIDEFTYRVEYTPREEKHILDSFSKSEKNVQLMDVSEFHYRKQMDFASSFSLSLYGMLTYIVFGQTEKCIILVSHDKSDGAKEKFKLISQKHRVQWVVSPLVLQSFTRDGQIFSTARIQVYDSIKDEIVLDKEYTGDTKSQGFELTCENGTLNCTINNIVGASLRDILLAISRSQ